MPAWVICIAMTAGAAIALGDDAKQVELALNLKKAPAPVEVALNAESPNLPDRPLTLVKLIKPIYPEAARAEALSGAVQIEVTVDEEGSVDTVKRLAGHPVLAEAAATAIRRWTYQAAVVNGKPVRSTTVVRLNFKAPE